LPVTINLSDDAPWKKIQKNTFTRWCNEHLRCVDKQINDLRFDLSDGLNLISLLEVLSHKRMFRKFHARPTLRQLKLDNVSVALEFLDREKIKLVSIDSKAIVDGNLKLILGLVWTLILHYSISIPVWEDEASDTVTKLTPEMKLLGWIQSKVPELPITNFSQDWQDGKALGALVDGLAPGLCPDWESWNAVQRVTNTREAMQQADDWLGVPQLIAPEEILDPGVDERSVMTYLSLFPKAKLKPGFSFFCHICYSTPFISVPKPKACRATGRGLQARGLRVGQLADFKVDTHKAGPGNLAVHIREPTGNEVAVKQREVLEGIYGFEYMPGDEGDYTVDITWANKHIPKSPFKVHVGPKAGQQKIRAWGPGLEGGTVGMPASFLVEASGVVAGMLGFAIEGPSQAKIECDDKNDGSCFVRFWPTEAGEYAVHVMCDDEEIEDSPFMACIAPKKKSFSPDKVKVYGAGVSPAGVLMNCQAEFTVDATQAGEGVLKIFIQTLEGSCIKVDVICEEAGIYNCSYTPTTICKHSIVVSWGGVSVPGSPFAVRIIIYMYVVCVWLLCADEEMDTDQVTEVNMKAGKGSRLDIDVVSPLDFPTNATKVSSTGILLKYNASAKTLVKAYGPGLRGGLLGQRAEFTIDTREAGSGRLTVTMEGPCQVTLQCMDNEDGTCAVFYLPAEHGEHTIRIFFDNSQIPGSPFLPVVHLPLDPSKVTVSGPGLTKGKVGEPCMVNIDCALAGSGDLSVEAVSDSGAIAKTEVQENKDGSYTVVYVPLTAGVYTLLLKYGGQVVPIFPAGIVVEPAVYKSHVKLTGQGKITHLLKKQRYLKSCLEWVVILCLSAFASNVKGDLANAAGNCDPSQVLADGLGLFQGLAGHPNKFSILFVGRGAGNGHLEVTIDGPSESKVSCKDNEDGSYTMEYIPSAAGQYDINITYGEKSIPGSPFKVTVKDVSATSAEIAGPRICAQSSQNFTFDSKKTGNIPETVTVISPQGGSPTSLGLLFSVFLKNFVEVWTADNGDGTCTVSYSPSVEGPHSLMVKYGDDTAFSSPFKFQVLPKHDGSFAQDCRSKKDKHGPGLEGKYCAKTPQNFTIGCSSAGAAPETVVIVNPDLLKVLDNADGTYHVTYTPSEEGAHSLVVRHAGEEAFCRWLFLIMFLMFSGKVIMPSGMTAQLDIIESGDGTITLKFSPTEEGLHHVLIKSCAADIPELSLQYYVNSSMNRCVKAHGRGLVYGVTHETAAFTIYHEDTAIGELDITVEGASESEVCCFDNKDGTCTVTYLPTQPGEYKIHVRHNDMHISGSPFKAKITDGSLRKSQVKLGTAVDFALDITEEDISLLTASISSPTRQDVPCSLKRQPDSHIGISFIPREVGDHLVSIKKDGKHVRSSPIPVCINLSDIGDASKVKVFGPGLHSGRTNHISEFVVNTRDAGYGGLTVAIEGPTNVVIHTEELEDGACRISYCPSKPGTYKVFIRFSDVHVQGSPFLAEVSDGELMRQSITHYQKPPLTANIGKECSLTFKISGIDMETMAAKVSAPSGMAAEAMVTATDRDTYAVSFVPEEMGVYSVSMKSRGQEIEGSPLQYTVGPLGEGGAAKVQMWGQGLHGAHAKIPADFNIWAREAGEGSLCVSVEGPGHTELHLDDHKDGSCSVSYTVEEPGNYQVSILFNEQHISASPFLVSVNALTENSEYSLEGLERHKATGMYKHHFHLYILWKQYKDHGLMSSGCAESLQPGSSLNSTCTCSAESILLSNVSEITSHGPGLSEASIGQKNTFYVDCSKAGENMLFVGMLGPTVPCERVTVRHLGKNQYSINYTLKERGKYILAVKWGDEHIPGSPFHINVL
uniref:Calponin-homology (CH) domain-containing protein n=1 Tax=Pygocentrus nattereri TaxID=42514 RepID=A0AAR2KRQ0_PYGNA